MRKTVDWETIVFDLNRNKINNSDIARKLDVSPQAVGQWRDGTARPNYERGVLLSALWMTHVMLDHNHIPYL